MSNIKYKWSEDDISYLIKQYSTTSTKDIAEKLKKPIRAVYQKAYSLKLKKTLEYLREHSYLQKGTTLGSKSWFKKGHIPKTKNKKQVEYMSEEGIKRTTKTRFKKGHIPKNHREIGSLRTNKEGYSEVKVQEPNVWELLHRKIYRETKGEIPSGYNVQFKDKNRNNVTPENLYLISRKKQMINNSIQRFPPEIKELIRLQNKLNKIIKDNG